MDSSAKMKKTISLLKRVQDIFREFAKADIEKFKKASNMGTSNLFNESSTLIINLDKFMISEKMKIFNDSSILQNSPIPVVTQVVICFCIKLSF